MSDAKSDTWENGLLLLLFNNTDFTEVGDSGGLLGSASAGNLYISLHTSSPGDSGDQTSNEANYTGYARKGVARSSAGWTVTANAVTNNGAITFDPCTGGSSAVTHFGIGTASSSTGKLLYHGALSATLNVSTGITPEFADGELDLTET
jgi:hypothetical protein